MGFFSKKKAGDGLKPVESSDNSTVGVNDHLPSTEKTEDTTQVSTTVPVAENSDDVAPKTEVITTDLRLTRTESKKSLSRTQSGRSVIQVPALEGDVEYPHGAKLAIITLALCLSVFLVALDNTIIATAIPKITDQFNSLTDVGWYGSAYLLTTCALQLFFGKLYTFYSIKWVYICSISVFEIGSAVCGAAPNSTALIIGRAVAGLGTGGLFSGALIIIAYSVPLSKRPMYTGIVGAMYGIASIAGPLLGGVFTDKVSWRWCFYINLPFGAFTLAIIFFFFHDPDRKVAEKISLKEQLKQLDLEGTAVFIAAIISILLALQWGGSTYAWGSWRIILCLVFGGVLLCVFLVMQYFKGDLATIPFRVISQRSVASSSWYCFCLGGAFFIIIYWLPIWFQAIKGASAFKSGIMCLPLVLGVVVSSILAGGLTTVIGYNNPFYFAGTVLMSIGAGLLTTFTTETGSPKWIGYSCLFGLGVGLGMQQPLMTVQTVLDLTDVPTGTAIIMFVQTFGGALLVSVAQNVFNNRLASELVKDAPGINPYIILRTGATNLATQLPPSILGGVQTAYNTALTDVFYASVALSALSILGAAFVQWRSVKGIAPGAGGA